MDKKILIVIIVIAVLVVIGIIYGISVNFNKTTDGSTGQITGGKKPKEVETNSCPCGCGEPLYGPNRCGCQGAEKARSSQ